MATWQLAILVKPLFFAVFMWAVVVPLRRWFVRMIPQSRAKAFLCADYETPGTSHQKTLAWAIVIGFYVSLFTAAAFSA